MTQYLHPSVASRIIDNSFVFETAIGSTVLFACGMAQKGPDNILTMLTTTDQANFIFGEPDMTLTGQTLYNVYQWLENGGLVYFIRVLPVDACYATALISLALDQNGSVKTVIPTVSPIVGASSLGAMQTILGAHPATVGTATTYPIGAIYPDGRGQAYNGLGFRIELLQSLDSTYDFRTYTFEVSAPNSLGVNVIVDGPFTVAFEPTARDRNRESLYWANVVNKYSTWLTVLDVPTYYSTIRSFINPSLNIDPLNIDIFYGQEMKGVLPANGVNQGVLFATPLTAGLSTNQVTSPLAADLTAINYLTGGTDGTWTGGQSEEALQVLAYTGQIDANATDKKQYLFDVMLDGNCPASVKNAMSTMAGSIRGDCMAMLDCGLQANAAQTLAFRQSSISMSDFHTAIFAQDFNVYDAYSGQEIRVTTPYFLASKIPPNDNQFGIQWSFSGPRRGVLSGFDAINFLPNETWKEILYDAQINYVEKDPKRINIGCQLTSQTVASALSKINNVRALLQIVRQVEAMVDEYRDEFQDATTYASMNYNLNEMLKVWTSNRTCSSISGTVYASDYDKQQNIARCQVEMVFTGLIERVFNDFIINK